MLDPLELDTEMRSRQQTRLLVTTCEREGGNDQGREAGRRVRYTSIKEFHQCVILILASSSGKNRAGQLRGPILVQPCRSINVTFPFSFYLASEQHCG